jgi:DNA-binding CsgD family transcriptional regulator
MFAVVFALRLAVENETGNGLSLLYSVPILLITVAYGSAAGAAAATTAVGLVYAWVELQDVHIGVIGLGMRALAFYIVPVAIWLARADLPRAPQPIAETAAAGADPPPRVLTRRESEVLGLIAAGHTNTEIAEQLVLSVRTIESHRANLQRKLGRPSRPELVRYAFRQGLVPDRRMSR